MAQKKTAKQPKIEEKEPKCYELGFLLMPIIASEQVSKEVDSKIKDAVSKHGGVIKREEAPKMIRLAYEIKKLIDNKYSTFKDAYFGNVLFSARPHEVENIKKELDSTDAVIRFIILSTDVPASSEKEKKAGETYSPEPSADSKPKQEMSEEDIDKEIEGLLTPSA